MAWLAAPLAWLLAGLAWAQVGAGPTVDAAPDAGIDVDVDPTSDHYGQRRLVRLFDFEEADDGNFEDMPISWFRMGARADTARASFHQQPLHQELVGRRGFPPYGEMRFNRPQREPGDHSLYLSMDGGNVGGFLEVGAVPAVPGSDYLITARIRTRGLEHARALLVTYFCDARGRRIDASMVANPPIRTADAWRTVAIKAPGAFPEAAWIGVEVLLVQPDLLRTQVREQHEVIYRDIRGEAWFDDITVWQLPSVRVTPRSTVGIDRAPARPSLDVSVRDLTGEALSARLRVTDRFGRVVADATHPAGAGRPTSWRWDPPITDFGWYRADLTVRDTAVAEAPIARASTAFLWLPQLQPLPSADADRFILSAEGAPMTELRQLAELLTATGVHRTVVSAWSRGMTPATADAIVDRRTDMLWPMLLANRGVTVSFSPMPAALATPLNLQPDWAAPMFAQPDERWSPYLAPLLLRLAQRVNEWQLGSAGATAWRPLDGLGETGLPSARAAMDRLAPGPVLVAPWSAVEASPDDLRYADRLLLNVPASVRPEHVADQIAGLGPLGRVRLHLPAPDHLTLTQADRADDLALRMVHGWAAGVGSLVITRPWMAAPESSDRLLAGPRLGVFSEVAQRLAGRRYQGDLDLGPGRKAMIFDGPAGGMLVVWRTDAAEDRRIVRMNLGGSAEQVDLFGNRQPLTMTDGRHSFALDASPTFIEGVDARLALFHAGFSVSPNFIASTQQTQTHQVRLTNPWPMTINGMIRFTGPERWQFEPERRMFSIRPGGETRFDLRLRFPASEVAGDTYLEARVEMSADRTYDVLLAEPMQVGLEDIRFEGNLVLEQDPATGRTDLLVTQLITNLGDQPLSMYAFATAPGFPRQQRLVQRLQPGRMELRIFRFPGGGDELGRQPVRTGVRATTGPAILNVVLYADE